MKIAILTFSLHGGGAERMVSRLANSFVKKGISTDILLLYDMDGRAYNLDEDVNVVDVCDKSTNVIKKRYVQIKKMCGYLKENMPDAVISFIYTTLPFPVIARKITGLDFKIIGTQRTNPRALKKIYNLMVRPFLREANGFVFQTKGSMECYPKWLQRKAIVIPNIAPSVNWIPINERVSDSICAVGRLTEAKDWNTIFKAMQLIRVKKPQAVLHIFGEGDKRTEYEQLVSKYGLLDAVVFEGFSKNVIEEIKKYEVFLFSSKAEGMPNSLIEAMSSGLVCVATDCDYGPSDLIENGKNGYLVPVSDYKAMAERTVELLEKRDLRERISLAATKISVSNSERAITDSFLSYIEKVCCKK